MHKTLIILTLLILLTACTAQTTPEKRMVVKQEHTESADYCEQDSDCICKGVHDGMCFIGNKAYYERYVDKGSECPVEDFCEGPYGNMVIKCVGRCMQMPG
ncbi:hypothetical protein KY362_03800 [Candidatus Woesearchaeota archaeon]|nr:hypothetical protein [Candidatus Woesearchaeota archaeon]